MPTKRQRRAQPRQAPPLNPAVFEYMLTGRRLPSGPAAGDEDAVETYSQLGALLRGGGRDLFEVHRLALLKRWTAKRPGSRPWAWWLHEAPEPRRVIDDPDGHVESCAPSAAFDVFWRRHHGVPFHGNTNTGEPVLLEAQAAYSRRLELLTPAETARLTPRHFEPVYVDVWGQEYTQTKDPKED